MMEDVADKMVDTNESCGGNMEKKEEPLYGPWLLVSYGRPNNKNFRGRNGKMNNGSSSFVSGKDGTNKIDNRGTPIGSIDDKVGKHKLTKSVSVGEKYVVKGATVAHGNGTGSRFDILNEDVEDMLVGMESQVLKKDSVDSAPREKNSLVEITNQGKEVYKDPLLRGKKGAKIGNENMLKGAASSSKGNGGGKDSNIVMQNCFSNVNCVSNPVMQNDNKFEVVASELAEAMGLVSK
ncbi:hypothetical protein Q3G72_001046 [Acer saccharum]|nr:hypothetical protein Q3G72_001046 [Acer saccharum]